jgi:FKBP-type peptidyl-prolyl cis-trans isomerase FklB
MSDNQFNSKLEKFSYCLGVTISANLIESGVKKIDELQFVAALQDMFSGKTPKISEDHANQILEDYMAAQNETESSLNFEEGLLFLSENRQKKDIIETESGLQFKIIKIGRGEKPSLKDHVKCHYHGTLLDGTVFDSSIERGQPAVFPVNGVISGWTESLQMMPVGSKWRLFVPSDLAYGTKGAGSTIGPNACLIFDVELLDIV